MPTGSAIKVTGVMTVGIPACGHDGNGLELVEATQAR